MDADFILPCDVHLPPATVLRKGVTMSTLLTAMRQREGMDESMTCFNRDAKRSDLDALARAGQDHVGDAGEAKSLRHDLAVTKDAAEVQRARFNRLLVAFHDAIRRPLGVVPASGEEFYDPAQACRADHGGEANELVSDHPAPEPGVEAGEVRSAALEEAAGILEGEVTGVETDSFACNGVICRNTAGHDRFISTIRVSDLLRRYAKAIRALQTPANGGRDGK